MLIINSPVGRNSTNLKADVRIIQLLINQNADLLQPQPQLDVDGIAGAKTILAIENVQRRMCNFGRPDGRVDPGGKTFKALAPDYISFTISGVEIPSPAMEVLTEILIDAGLSQATVTSGVRTAAEQARVMYDNIERRGVEYNCRLYGPFGDQVIKVFEENCDKKRADVITMMQTRIEELGPANVSKHCSDTHYVFDVAPSSISDPICFAAAVNRHKAVSKLLQPPDDPAFHIEIPRDSTFFT